MGILHLVTAAEVLEMSFQNEAKFQSGKAVVESSSQTPVERGGAQATVVKTGLPMTQAQWGGHRALAGISKKQDGDSGSGQKQSV